MKTTNKKISKGTIASFVFLVIAVAGTAPWYDAVSNPEDGFNGYGQGWAAIIGIIVIAIPASFISLFFGLTSVRKSKLAYISIIPTSMFLLYCAYIWVRIQ